MVEGAGAVGFLLIVLNRLTDEAAGAASVTGSAPLICALVVGIDEAGTIASAFLDGEETEGATPAVVLTDLNRRVCDETAFGAADGAGLAGAAAAGVKTRFTCTCVTASPTSSNGACCPRTKGFPTMHFLMCSSILLRAYTPSQFSHLMRRRRRNRRKQKQQKQAARRPATPPAIAAAASALLLAGLLPPLGSRRPPVLGVTLGEADTLGVPLGDGVCEGVGEGDDEAQGDSSSISVAKIYESTNSSGMSVAPVHCDSAYETLLKLSVTTVLLAPLPICWSRNCSCAFTTLGSTGGCTSFRFTLALTHVVRVTVRVR